MPEVVKYLQRLNRKERFALLNHVLDAQQGKEVFRLAPVFARRLADKIGIGIPDNAFVAMDYHLDWISMALHFSRHGHCEGKPFDNENLFRGNQQDVDLLIAFENEGGQETVIVLVEAKADTPWNNKQLRKKAGRLKLIFGNGDFENGDSCRVVPYFVLMSPEESEKIETEDWPSWMKAEGNDKAHWLELPMRGDLLKVTRCDSNGDSDKEGEMLKVETALQSK